jgi:hypothetical protein
LDLLGIRLVGLNGENASKLLLSAALVAALLLATVVLRSLLRLVPGEERAARVRFWSRQAVSLLVAAAGVVGIASIWFDNPRSLSAALGS